MLLVDVLMFVFFVTFVLLISSLSYCDAHILLSFAVFFLLFVNCLFIIISYQHVCLTNLAKYWVMSKICKCH